MPTTETNGPGRGRRLWAQLRRLGGRGRRGGQPTTEAPGAAGPPAGAGWDAPADARAQEARRLAAAGTRLRAEAARLRAERAYGVVDLGAQERHAGQARAHRAALRRFWAARPRPAARRDGPPGA
jgi:hypothetical protein